MKVEGGEKARDHALWAPGGHASRAGRRDQRSGARSVSAVFKDSQEAVTCALRSRGGGHKTPGGQRAGVGTGGGLLGQCESLGIGSIFKDEKPLENFEQR